MAPGIVPPITALVLMNEEGVGVSKEEVGSEEEEAGTAVEELVSDGVIVGTAAVIMNRISFGFTLVLKKSFLMQYVMSYRSFPRDSFMLCLAPIHM